MRADLTGTEPVALNSTWQTLEQVGVQAKTFEQTIGDRVIPHPVQFEVLSTVEQAGIGFRNQDINSIQEMWLFFKQYLV